MSSPLVADVELYLAHRASVDWSERTVTGMRSHFTRIIRWFHRRTLHRWSSVTPQHGVDYVLYLQACGLSPATREAHVFALRGLGEWLLGHGRVLTDPMAHLTVPDADDAPLPPAPLSDAQIAAVFAALPGQMAVHLRNRMLIELLYSCGLRSEESVDCNVNDLDLHERTLTVRDGKGGRPRIIPLMTSTLLCAKDYRALRNQLLAGPDHGALLLGERGKRLHRLMPGILLRKLSRVVGFRVHPHLLRHSRAVHFLRRRMDLRMIQAFLGHADLDTTKIYLRLVPGHLREEYLAAMPTLLPMPDPPQGGGLPAAQAD